MVPASPEEADPAASCSSLNASKRTLMPTDAHFGVRSSATSTRSTVSVPDMTATILPSPTLARNSRRSVHDDALVSAAAALTQLTQSSAISLALPSPPTSETASPTSIPPRMHVDSRAQEQSPFLDLARRTDSVVSNNESKHSLSLPNNTPNSEPQHPQHPLVNRVARASHHPIVTNAVRYYELSKRNYAPFNYAAVKIEKVAKPVVEKIEDNLNSRHQASIERKEAAGQRLAQAYSAGSMEGHETKKRKRSIVDMHDPSLAETRKRIKFCLHMLRAANDQINTKVGVLQQKMSDRHRKGQERKCLNTNRRTPLAMPESTSVISNGREDDSALHNTESAVQETKTEIITTVKKIIHLISDFRPLALSPNAVGPVDNTQMPLTRQAQRVRDLKRAIREIIFHLPFNVQQNSLGSDATLASAHKSVSANDRILVFAQESLDMITKLTTVFDDQLDKVENWVAGEDKDQGIDGLPAKLKSLTSREGTPISDASTLCAQPELENNDHGHEQCESKRIRLHHILNEKS